MSDAPYELVYWPTLPGRGEFIRLVFEDAQVPYVDVAREVGEAGFPEVIAWRKGERGGHPVFAPPILHHGEVVLAQVAAIVQYVAARHGLWPTDPAGAAQALQLQLTLADVVQEVHDTHHPVTVTRVFEEQREAAIDAGHTFCQKRLPGWLGFFERVLVHSGGPWLLGDACAAPDLGLFHVVRGLQYAFPRSMAKVAPEVAPGVMALADAVAARPGIAAYLGSPRRLPFRENGIFRCYPELDPA